MLDEAMRIEILKALWPYFLRRGAVPDVIPRLLRWHQATLGAGIMLGASGIKARIRSWWRKSDEDEPGWGLVWGSFFAPLDSPDQPQKEREALLRLALKAIPVQPECEADLPVWERAAKLDPPIVDFLNAVIRKLATVRSPYKLEKGVDLLLRFVAPGELVIRLSTALQETMAGRAWPHIWEDFLIKRPDEQGLLALGRDWLTDRENQPEWSYVWRKLIDQDFERDALLPRGRNWLSDRENQPEWAFVWQKLIDQNFEHDTLLPRGRDWLTGRENQSEWAFVLRKLIDQNFERDTLLPRGRGWLEGREDQPGWYLVADAVRVGNMLRSGFPSLNFHGG